MENFISYMRTKTGLTLKSVIPILLVFLLTISVFLSLFFINLSLVYAASLQFPDLGIEAEGFVLIDSRTGIVLRSDNANKRELYPASTTKIMTAIIALENKSLDTVMTASQAAINDIGVGGMNIGIMAGEELTLQELLNAMLVCSANEAANIIAENVAPSREDFVNLMNKRAKELGAINTNFVNTNGMHHKDHYTTAKDMAIIAQHAMSIPSFREIVKKDSYNMPSTNKHESWNTLYTTNKLLRYGTSDDCSFDIIGIKTGFTTPAGHNLVAAAVDKNGMELISIILGVKNERSWENIYEYTEKLLQYGFNNFSVENLIEKNAYVTTVNVADAKDNLALDLVADQSITSILPLINVSTNVDINAGTDTEIDNNTDDNIDNDWMIIKKVHLNPIISAPVNKGEVLGYIEFIKDDTVLGKANIIAANSIEKEIATYSFRNSFLFKLFRTIIIIIISFGLLRFILKRMSRKLNSRKKCSRRTF